jgi:ABC-type anion transport system duplicated permease subunit
MGLFDGVLGGVKSGVSGVGSSATSGAKGVGAGMGEQAIAMVAGMIVQYAFASSIKKDQKRFEQEISKLDEKKQLELLAKVQQVQTELERQNIVFQYIDKVRIEELKKQDNNSKKYLYIGLGVGVIIYALIILKLKKR